MIKLPPTKSQALMSESELITRTKTSPLTNGESKRDTHPVTVERCRRTSKTSSAAALEDEMSQDTSNPIRRREPDERTLSVIPSPRTRGEGDRALCPSSKPQRCAGRRQILQSCQFATEREYWKWDGYFLCPRSPKNSSSTINII